eukprot:10543203-Lingulodinium_polyedra.AAC.1
MAPRPFGLRSTVHRNSAARQVYAKSSAWSSGARQVPDRFQTCSRHVPDRRETGFRQGPDRRQT